MERGQRLILALVVVLVIAAIALALRQDISPQVAAAWIETQRSFVAGHVVAAATGYVVFYVLFAALALPGAWIVSTAGGALFGPWLGVCLVSLSSTSGATLAMLAARYLGRDAVASRFPVLVARVDQGVAKDGGRWLFAARLTPVIPFFAVNLAVGLTNMPVQKFALITMIGALPFVVIYVLAGSQIASIQHAGDVFSLPILVTLFAMAIAPFCAKGICRWRAARAQLARWRKPEHFDYNLVVVGAGSAGLVAAYAAAAGRARVALIEEREMGGDCLNTGCVPSKAFIRSAKLAHEGATAVNFGLRGGLEPDFAAVMARVHSVVAAIAPHDSAERYRSLGVEVVTGHARIVDPWTVEVAGRRLTGRRIVLATGAEPLIPSIPGLAGVGPLTSETLWRLTERPELLLVIGGGAIGCEIAQAFARLGSRVSLIEGAVRVLPHEDDEVSDAMRATLQSDGVEVIEGIAVTGFEPGFATLADGRTLAFSRVLVAVGRRPRTRGFGLEDLGLLDNGRLVVDERLRTQIPTIFAAGDVIGQLQFTHAAGRYGVTAAINALLAPVQPAKAELPAFPAVIYSDPEIARVGLSEREARAKGIAFEVTRYDLSDLDRAIVDGAARGFVKVLTVPGRDRILGATIVGARAGDMLSEFTLAMRHRLGLKAILNTIHPYPGWSDAARATAGEWRHKHAPTWALRLSERLFAGLRG